MKRIIRNLLSLLVVASFVLILSGCTSYQIKAGPMKHLVGTYELTEYRLTYDAEPEVEHNLIEENSIKCFLIVNEDGTGYYIYSDKETELYVKKVSLTYTYDSEEPDKVSEIEYNDGRENPTKNPNGGNEKFGFVDKMFKKFLNYRLSNVKVTIFGKEVGDKVKGRIIYSKVSKDVTFKYAQKKFGKDLSALVSE